MEAENGNPCWNKNNNMKPWQFVTKRDCGKNRVQAIYNNTAKITGQGTQDQNLTVTGTTE